MSYLKRPVAMKYIRSYVERSQGRLTTAKLSRSDTGSNALKLIIATCNNLAYLELQHGSMVKPLLDPTPLTQRLTSLVLNSSCEVSFQTLSCLLRMYKQLTRAEFEYISYVSWAKDSWPDKMENLRHLSFGYKTYNGALMVWMSVIEAV